MTISGSNRVEPRSRRPCRCCSRCRGPFRGRGRDKVERSRRLRRGADALQRRSASSARDREGRASFDWELNYTGLTGVTQAHIHFAARAITAPDRDLLCSNLGNGPPGTHFVRRAPQP